MRKFIINLLICTVAFPFTYVIASLAYFGWFEAFVENRDFAVYLGLLGGDSILIWSFYFIFFLTIGIGLHALLRTHRPIVWACCFGIAYSLFRLATVTNYISHPNLHVYLSIVGEYLMPVIGCTIGALLGSKLRRKAPNYAIKVTAE
jgi:hypothetical protein